MPAQPVAETESAAVAAPPRTVAIHTHGCKLNQADSRTLAREFSEAGYRVVAADAPAEVVVLNTCTVTATADAKARQYLRAAARRNPGALVVATGCYAQRAGAELAGLPVVSLTLGNTEKPALVAAVTARLAGAEVDATATEQPGGGVTGASGLAQPAIPLALSPTIDPAAQSPTPRPVAPPDPAAAQTPLLAAQTPLPGAAEGRGLPFRSRAMVKIQEGCDQVCAYCIVPKVRGRERSLPPESIISEIRRCVAEGYREVALTGTQLGTYGFELDGVGLRQLLRRILDETGVERLRVSSLQAHEITPELLELWDDRRLCPHFHIPLQSGSDAILRAMRRRYDTRQFAATVGLVRQRRPDAGITTDLIAGFPGESASDFAASCAFAQAMQFSDLHLFPYSPRPGTSAAYYGGQVAEADKRERMARLLALAAESRRQFRRGQLGRTASALWERAAAGGVWHGLTGNYLRVCAVSNRPLANAITDVRLDSLDGDRVWATVV